MLRFFYFPDKKLYNHCNKQAGQEVSLAPAAIEKKVRQKQYEAGDEGDKTNLLWPEE